MMGALHRDIATIIIVGLALVVGGLVGTPYILGVLIIFGMVSILVLSYRTITTMGGWSFAHVAIMGIGGYSVAIFSKAPFEVPVLVAVALGGVFAALFAAILSWPVLRTRQYYFFLSTFAAGEALRQCFIQIKEITGGTAGIAFIARPGILPDPSSAFQFLWLVAVILVLLGLFYAALDASDTGKKIKAVGEDEALSSSLGIDAWALRALGFILGSFGAGIAGGLFASYNGIMSPSDINAMLMFKIVAACVIGGTARFSGPLLGLLFLTLIEEIFRFVPEFVPMIWGALVIAAIILSQRAGGGLKLRKVINA
ncbi:branched-chain amino acid ABC transporter permease [Mesorhizobium ciceri]|uniref:branched-chain amino acid ABC transporter permease n=1 Tax=Mesorhizobium TaxID=68287 RepID=UPI00047D2C4A|nr:branched-chain amino acid ABC transporter permease [Mesorhizobium ciceri]